MQRAVELEIFGQRLTVASDEDEGYLRELAASLDRRMREVAASAPTASTLNVALLAALQVVDEYSKVQREQAEMNTRIEELSRSLVATLEEDGRAGQER